MDVLINSEEKSTPVITLKKLRVPIFGCGSRNLNLELKVHANHFGDELQN